MKKRLFLVLCRVFLCLVLPGLIFLFSVAARAQDGSTPGARPELFLQIGHGGDVAAIAFSPDGQTIVTGGIDATFKLWHARSGSLLRTVAAPGDVTALAFSPDGSTLATSGHGRSSIELWDAHEGKPLRVLQSHEGFVYGVAFSPDGKTLASGSADKTVKIWETASGRVLQTLTGHENIVNCVAFGPDGKTLASAGMDNSIKLWDAAGGKLVRSLDGGHQSGVYGVAFSPDGKQLVSCGGDYASKAELVLWDVASGATLRRFSGHEKLVASVAFSPDGTTIASGSWDKTFRLWNAATGQEKSILRAPADATTTAGVKGRLLVWYPVAFSPDGQSLAVAARDRAASIWSTPGGDLARTLGGRKGQVFDAAFSPDGSVIAAANDFGDLKIWSAAGGELIRTLNSGGDRRVLALAFSPDGRRLACSGSSKGTVTLWDVPSGALLQTFKTRFDYLAPAVAFSPDGNLLAALSWDGASWKSVIELWNAQAEHTAQPVRVITVPENATIYSIAFSPDGKTLATGHRDQTLRLWNTLSGQELRALNCDGLVHHVAFSPDGKTIAGQSSGKTIKLWNADSGALLRTFSIPDEGSFPIAFSPDGRLLAVGSRSAITLWDVASGQAQSTLSAHEDSVTALAFSPDGARLLSGGQDTTLRLWDLKTMRLMATLLPMPQVADAALDARPIEIGAKAIEIGAKAAQLSNNEWFAVTPEGFFDCSANAAKFIKWRMDGKLYPAERYYRKFRRPDMVQKALRGERIDAPRMTAEDVPPEAQFVSLKYSGDEKPNEVVVTLEARGKREIKDVLLWVNGRPLPPESQKPVETQTIEANLPARPIEIGAKPIEIGSKAIEIGAKALDIGSKPLDVGAKPAWSTPDAQTSYRIARRYTFRAPLPVGANKINVRAMVYDTGDLGSTPTEIFLSNSNATPVAGRLFALCIGVSNYARGKASTPGPPIKGEISNLKYPAIDAQSLAARLKEEGAPLYEKVEVKTLTDEQATLPNIRAALKWLQESVRPGQVDTAILCLSGHGISDAQGRYYFPAHEFDAKNFRETSLPGSELQSELGGRLRAKDVFLFVDTCHSGALAGARSDDLNFEVIGSGVTMMASSAATQYSYESSEWGHGAFSFALLKSLANKELSRGGIIHFNVLTYAVPYEIAKLLKAAGQSEDAMAPVVPLEGRVLDEPVAQTR